MKGFAHRFQTIQNIRSWNLFFCIKDVEVKTLWMISFCTSISYKNKVKIGGLLFMAWENAWSYKPLKTDPFHIDLQWRYNKSELKLWLEVNLIYYTSLNSFLLKGYHSKYFILHIQSKLTGKMKNIRTGLRFNSSNDVVNTVLLFSDFNVVWC